LISEQNIVKLPDFQQKIFLVVEEKTNLFGSLHLSLDVSPVLSALSNGTASSFYYFLYFN